MIKDENQRVWKSGFIKMISLKVMNGKVDGDDDDDDKIQDLQF